MGELLWIGVRKTPRAELQPLSEAECDPSRGLIGDHYAKIQGKRQVTLIERESFDHIQRERGESVGPEQLRRNLVVGGLRLAPLVGQFLRIGEEVVLEATGPCDPCARMNETVGPGAMEQLDGLAGITARVVHGGRIRVGDAVRTCPAPLRVVRAD